MIVLYPNIKADLFQKYLTYKPMALDLVDLVQYLINSQLEPVGLDRGDGKRPDDITLFPFQSGKSLI